LNNVLHIVTFMTYFAQFSETVLGYKNVEIHRSRHMAAVLIHTCMSTCSKQKNLRASIRLNSRCGDLCSKKCIVTRSEN